MSLDSILENPSLKNMILNNSVRDFQGFLTGFSYNNTLATFAPEELMNQVDEAVTKQAGTSTENAMPKINPAEEEAVKTIVSKILICKANHLEIQLFRALHLTNIEKRLLC